MKTFIIMKSGNEPETAEDIKVNDIYGIYQNKCKAFWECKLANLKIMKENNLNHLKYYVLKEINLETSEILMTYKLIDRNNIIDNNNIKYKIPIFYNEIEEEYNVSYN